MSNPKNGDILILEFKLTFKILNLKNVAFNTNVSKKT